jgi:hypothetical protein
MSLRSAVQYQSVRTWVVAVAVLALPSCSIQVQEPAANATVTLPSKISRTKVVVTGNASYPGLKVVVDGIAFSNRMVSKSSKRDEGDLSLLGGGHTLVASADVYCWYCSGQKHQSTATRTFSVEILGKTTFAQGDSLSWASLSNANLSYASDTRTSTTRWELTRIGGIASNIGMIESIQFAGVCLRSPDNTNGSVIALTSCDATDTRQQWFGTRQQPLTGPKGFYRFENRAMSDAGMTWGCMTESNNQVIQSACNDTPDRLWAVRRNMENTFESDPTPWGQ